MLMLPGSFTLLLLMFIAILDGDVCSFSLLAVVPGDVCACLLFACFLRGGGNDVPFVIISYLIMPYHFIACHIM